MKTAMAATFFGLMALAGCASDSVVSRDLGGAKGLQLNCSGLTSSWEKCYSKAERSCGTKGYRVLAKTSDVKEDPEDGFMGWSPGSTSRTMIVRCNNTPQT